MKSALVREESRGAHQRSDFKELNKSCEFNCLIETEKGNLDLKISKIPIKKIKKELSLILANQRRQIDIRNKLLE